MDLPAHVRITHLAPAVLGIGADARLVCPVRDLRLVAVARGGAGETSRGHAGSRPGRGAKGSMNRRATHAAGTSRRMKMRSPGGPAVYTIRFAVRKFDRITDEITRFGAGCSCAPTVVHRSRTRAY